MFNECKYEQLWAEESSARLPKQQVQTRQTSAQAESELPPRAVDVIEEYANIAAEELEHSRAGQDTHRPWLRPPLQRVTVPQ